jgi:hypothetical protein
LKVILKFLPTNLNEETSNSTVDYRIDDDTRENKRNDWIAFWTFWVDSYVINHGVDTILGFKGPLTRD